MSGGRVDEQPRLVRAEGDRRVGPYGLAEHLAGVRLHAARQVHGEHGRVACGDRAHQLRRLGPQSAAAPDPGDAVDDEVDGAEGAERRAAEYLSARGQESGQRRPVDLVRRGEQGADSGPAPGQPGSRVQGVPAVVTAAHQEQHPGAVDPPVAPEQVTAGHREAGGGALHQRPSGSRSMSAFSAARTVSTL